MFSSTYISQTWKKRASPKSNYFLCSSTYPIAKFHEISDIFFWQSSQQEFNSLSGQCEANAQQKKNEL